MKKFLFVFCLLGSFCFSQVDSVVFCLSNKGIPGLYLSKVNVTTGAVTYISPTVIGNAVASNGATIDQYKSIYYFIDFSQQIIGLDLFTGTVVTSGPLSNPNTDSFGQIIFNASDSVIYGLAGTVSPPSVFLGKINPSTGVVTKISGTSLSTAYLGSSATIDPFTKTYYYVNESNVILGVDLNTGTITSSATITNVNGQYFDLMQFNASDKMIYGLARKFSPPEVYLAKIDPLTGGVTNISTSPLSTALSSSGSLLDPCNNSFYYIKEGGILQGANCSIGNGIVAVTPSSQILEMRYNYKCHLDFIFSGINENQSTADLNIYPNPSSDYLNLKGIGEVGSSIEIIDALGRKIMETSFANSINISKLTTGIYTLRILTKDNHSYYSKFVKE